MSLTSIIRFALLPVHADTNIVYSMAGVELFRCTYLVRERSEAPKIICTPLAGWYRRALPTVGVTEPSTGFVVADLV